MFVYIELKNYKILDTLHTQTVPKSLIIYYTCYILCI